MKRLDPTNFAKLTDAPMKKMDDWEWCQKDADGNWRGMTRYVWSDEIEEYYYGSGFPCYVRVFTNDCRFEGLQTGLYTFTGTGVYYNWGKNLSGNF
eukprot:CAMPEP_0168616952 /NCGR_PEP_ID=MMETSP0449_2-20121227/5293_1 /TAXON_ID=1082188 /ORGANISM="Strombidium rassoulzadegani, Strain ras09" /LENGTH=95 /DNA_ID=CAMNT_0008657755 /DNA_START=18 /DNA_END=302 /DNA_ORIENTATION=-